jgi:hypothetical protein
MTFCLQCGSWSLVKYLLRGSLALLHARILSLSRGNQKILEIPTDYARDSTKAFRWLTRQLGAKRESWPPGPLDCPIVGYICFHVVLLCKTINVNRLIGMIQRCVWLAIRKLYRSLYYYSVAVLNLDLPPLFQFSRQCNMKSNPSRQFLLLHCYPPSIGQWSSGSNGQLFPDSQHLFSPMPERARTFQICPHVTLYAGQIWIQPPARNTFWTQHTSKRAKPIFSIPSACCLRLPIPSSCFTPVCIQPVGSTLGGSGSTTAHRWASVRLPLRIIIIFLFSVGSSFLDHFSHGSTVTFSGFLSHCKSLIFCPSWWLCVFCTSAVCVFVQTANQW